MRSVVLYESLFGSTRTIAAAVAEGLGRGGDVRLVRFGDASDDVTEGVDLLVLGGPTHAWGMTRENTRQQPHADGYAIGAREWLDAWRPGRRVLAATFDTRLDKPKWLTGSAAKRMAGRLERGGCELAAPPESFLVEGTEGPLKRGEEERARSWGEQLALLTRSERRSA